MSSQSATQLMANSIEGRQRVDPVCSLTYNWKRHRRCHLHLRCAVSKGASHHIFWNWVGCNQSRSLASHGAWVPCTQIMLFEYLFFNTPHGLRHFSGYFVISNKLPTQSNTARNSCDKSNQIVQKSHPIMIWWLYCRFTKMQQQSGLRVEAHSWFVFWTLQAQTALRLKCTVRGPGRCRVFHLHLPRRRADRTSTNEDEEEEDEIGLLICPRRAWNRGRRWFPTHSKWRTEWMRPSRPWKGLNMRMSEHASNRPKEVESRNEPRSVHQKEG